MESLLKRELEDNPKLEKFINERYAIYSIYHPLYMKRLYVIKCYGEYAGIDGWAINFDSLHRAYKFCKNSLMGFETEFITTLRFVREK